MQQLVRPMGQGFLQIFLIELLDGGVFVGETDSLRPVQLPQDLASGLAQLLGVADRLFRRTQQGGTSVQDALGMRYYAGRGVQRNCRILVPRSRQSGNQYHPAHIIGEIEGVAALVQGAQIALPRICHPEVGEAVPITHIPISHDPVLACGAVYID